MTRYLTKEFLTLLFFGIGSVSLPAFADLPEEENLESHRQWAAYVEPLAGVAVGFYGNDTTSALGAHEKIDSMTLLGPGVGVRGGALYEYYFFGADLQYQLLWNPSLSSSFENFTLGITAGGSLPTLPLRFWIGVQIVDELGTGTGSLSADSFKIGAGYFLKPRVSLNLEITFRGYGKVNVNDVFVSPNYTSFYASISLPLTFYTSSMTAFSKGKHEALESTASEMY